MRIAIIGTGVSGLVAAHLLHRQHDLAIYEAGDRVGGHSHTVDVEDEAGRHPVDTGFVVFNTTTYPLFTRLLERLGVPSQPAGMSFSVACPGSGLEYCGTSLNTLFAQRRNLVRPTFLRMIRDILRFNREAKTVLIHRSGRPSLGEYLRNGGFSEAFVDHYLVPMGAAIWSAPPRDLLDFPAPFFARFFHNHGLLGVGTQLPWRTVSGGSRTYVERLTAPFRERIRLRTPVLDLRRRRGSVTVRTPGLTEQFDHVIIATHSDQALGLLADPTDAEREVLGAIPYQANRGALHRDDRLLPRRPRARASWNYRLPTGEEAGAGVLVTYDMSRLQSLPTPSPICVSLNLEGQVRRERLIRRLEFSHPIYTAGALAAQARHGEISGASRTHYCGAYWGNGFHEDGVASAVRATAPFGAGL